MTALTWCTAMSMFAQGYGDTFNAKCALVGVWFVGVLFYEFMKALIRGDIGGR